MPFDSQAPEAEKRIKSKIRIFSNFERLRPLKTQEATAVFLLRSSYYMDLSMKKTDMEFDKTQRNKTNKPQRHDQLFSHSQAPGPQGSNSSFQGQGATDWTSVLSNKMISSHGTKFL